jgi:hypothetical protein
MIVYGLNANFNEECKKVDLTEVSYQEEGFNMIVKLRKVL